VRVALCVACFASIVGCIGSDTIGSGGESFGGEAPWYPPGVGAGSSDGGGELTPDGGYPPEGGYPPGVGAGAPMGGFPSEGGAPPGSFCGDDSCDPNEDCDSCADDCGICMCETDAFEPNGSSPTATPVSNGVDYCDLSICAGDVDWIEFDVGSSFTAEITFSHADGDLELEIFSGQTANYINGSYSANDDESVTLNVSPGTYWARIYGDAGDENWSYCFRVD
jgi:hypothetical protein